MIPRYWSQGRYRERNRRGGFCAFADPLLNQAGAVAFVAKLAGTSVTPANDYGLWTNAFASGLTLVVREGDAAAGGQIARIVSVALESGTVAPPRIAYVSRLTGASIPAENTLALWSYNGTVTRLLLQTGMNMAFATGTKTLKSFNVLGMVLGAEGQGFALSDGVMTALLTFTDWDHHDRHDPRGRHGSRHRRDERGYRAGI